MQVSNSSFILSHLSLCKPKQNSINHTRLLKIWKESFPLTELYKDSSGHAIQIWKTKLYGLIGAVFNQKGNLKIIPESKIRNPLNDKQTPEELSFCLESSKNKRWDIAFDLYNLTLTIWPHIVAGGKERTDVAKKLSQLEQAQKNAVKKQEFPDGRIRYYEKEKLSDKPGNVRGACRVTEWNSKTGVTRSWHECYRNNGSVFSVHPKQINGQDVTKGHYPPTGKEIALRQKETNNTIDRNPATKHFQQTLQQTQLTGSYNTTHSHDPVPAKATTQGSIGGVACTTGYFKGLFESPEELFETGHSFCLPTAQDGKPPFTNLELRQILRELAIGIYVHNTIPFFSLHFNPKADLFPVIHPAYENTLVGRVISMLDYIMKGYLNGGVFNEKFVDEWQKDPNWKSNALSALENLIDFTEYCQKHFSGKDKDYYSVMFMQENITLKPNSESAKNLEKQLGIVLGIKESSLLESFIGCTNSFRILAKQNSLRKEGNCFLIDADFDVEYTINPSQLYKTTLEAHVRKHGVMPHSYKVLEIAYQQFVKLIHNHLVKFPLCRDYFAMLNVINFFSGYFSTLKKHRKVPVLSSMEACIVKGCPSIFPHLPIRTLREKYLEINDCEALRNAIHNHQKKFKSYCKQFQSYLISNGLKPQRNELIDIVKESLESNIISSTKALPPRLVQKKIRSKDIQEALYRDARNMICHLEKLVEQQVENLVPSFLSSDSTSKMYYDLNSLSILNSAISSSYKIFAKFFEEVYQETLSTKKSYTKSDDILVQAFGNIQVNPPLTYSEIRSFLDHMYNHFHARINQVLLIFESLPNCYKDQNVNYTSVCDADIFIKPELQAKEINLNKRVVGGCGMKLQPQTVQTSRVALQIFQANWQLFQKMSPETWTKVDLAGIQKGYAFSLQFENVPVELNDNYEWMETHLFIPKDSNENIIKERIAIQDSIEGDEKSSFEKLIAVSNIINDKTKDLYQRTLLHHAARSHNPHYAKALLSKGLSIFSKDIHGFLPIHYAAMSGALDTLKVLLSEKNSRQALHTPSKNGSTALICAIQNHHKPVVQYFLSAGVTGYTLSSGYTTLHCALHHGNTDIINDILDQREIVRECINQLCEEGTPLMMACELDSVELVEKMIKLNADPKIKRRDELTALEIAILRNCKPIVECLMKFVEPSANAIETVAKQGSIEIFQHFASKSFFLNYRSPYQDTVLHFALRFGNLAGASLIVQNCNDIHLLTTENIGKESPFSLALGLNAWDFIEVLFKKNAINRNMVVANIEVFFKSEYNLLMNKIFDLCLFNQEELKKYALTAAQAGNYQALSLLFLPKKVNLESIEGPNGWRLPHYMAQCDGINLFKGAVFKEKNYLQPLPKEKNKTLPYIAALNKSVRILRFILEQMRKENIPLSSHFDNKHLFHAIIQGGSLKCVRTLLDTYNDRKKELVNVSLDETGMRPIHLAAKMCTLGILKLLIKEGADIESQDKNGNNVLVYALRTGSEKIITFLLREYNDQLFSGQVLYTACLHPLANTFMHLEKFNFTQDHYYEALFIAVQDHNEKAFQKLRQKGAAWDFDDKDSMIPILFLMACRSGQNAILKDLLSNKTLQAKVPNALLEAAQNGHTHTVNMLMHAGYEIDKNVHCFTKEYATLRLLINDREAYVKGILQFQNLLVAAKENDFDKVINAIEKNALNEPIQIEYENNLIWGTPFQLFLRIHCNLIKHDSIRCILKREDLDPNIQDCDGNTIAHLLLQADIFPYLHKSINWTIVNHEKQNPLHFAAQYASSKVLKLLLEELKRLNQSCLVDAVDQYEKTPIFHSIETSKEPNVEILIKNGACLNIYDCFLQTPLIIAMAATNSLSTVKLLLTSGANPNQVGTPHRLAPIQISMDYNRDEIGRSLLFHHAHCHVTYKNNWTLLHGAANMNKIDLLRLFIAKGLSLEVRDDEGMLPIHYASIYGNEEIVKTILSMHKEMLEAPMEIAKNNAASAEIGATPLLLAAGRNQTGMIQYLLKENANIEAQTKYDLNILSYGAMASKSTLEQFAGYKIMKDPKLLCSALQMAIRDDNIDVVKYIYNKGIPINSDIMFEHNGIQLAARHGSLLTSLWLLQKAADPFQPCPTGEDSLQLAAGNDSISQFSAMIDFIAPDLDELRNNRETLLHTAAKAGKLSHVAFLLKNFANINVKDDKGNLPIHLAARNGHSSVVSLLLACGADFTSKSANGKELHEIIGNEDEKTKKILNEFKTVYAVSTKKQESQLHIAVRCRNSLAVLLLSHLGEADKANSEGATPLHIAAEMGQSDSCIHLMSSGANVNAWDLHALTPLAYAKNPEIQELIKRAGGAL